MMDPCLYTFIDKLEAEHTLYASEWQQLLDGYTPRLAAYLFEKSRRARIQFYGHDVYIRGLIEFTNYCRNNCYYCGIRSGNTHVHRYRLTKEEILSCCETGYELGFRTFVLQGGEDPYYTTARLSDVVPEIEGMVIAADGGDDPVVVKNLTEAVQALFGVEAHKIKIMKRTNA